MDTLSSETTLASGDVAMQPSPGADPEFWNCLIDETEAAAFLGLARGTLANMRQSGRSPRFVRISSRCVKFRRCDLKTWCDDRLRSSTSDPGPDKAAA